MAQSAVKLGELVIGESASESPFATAQAFDPEKMLSEIAEHAVIAASLTGPMSLAPCLLLAFNFHVPLMAGATEEYIRRSRHWPLV